MFEKKTIKNLEKKNDVSDKSSDQNRSIKLVFSNLKNLSKTLKYS